MALNNDFPVPFAVYAKTLVGTPDEIWTHLLRIERGREKHTELEWSRILATYMKRKA